MNCQRAGELWDDARDRTLPAADQVLFDQHLHGCQRCAALWRRESLMLGALADDAAPGDIQAFKSHVMRQVAAADQVDGSPAAAVSASPDPIVMKLAPWAALAAAVALVISLWATMKPGDQPQQAKAPVAVTAGPTHPVSVLVQDLTRGIDQPQRLRESIEKTTSYLTLNQLAALLEREVAPAAPTETPNTRG